MLIRTLATPVLSFSGEEAEYFKNPNNTTLSVEKENKCEQP